jgi:predicted ArsR family transcriptional regulator
MVMGPNRWVILDLRYRESGEMTDTTEQGAPGGDSAATVPARSRRRAGTPQPAALVAASALTHPARRRIAETLGGAPNGLTVADLVEQIGDLHHNAIRNHLRILARAGLVAVERNPPSGRGRPTERFLLVDPEASRIAAQHELLRLLVTMLVDVGVDHARAREFGRAYGPDVVIGLQRDELIGSLARLGFAPHETTSVKDAARGVLEVRLDHCPFADAVLAPGGTIICALHRGLLEGAARTAPSPVAITSFEVRDPHEAGCIVRVEGVEAIETAAPAPRRARAGAAPSP